jgi:ubiquinone/menaquinone biosynthesis C-methylase UbiE
MGERYEDVQAFDERARTYDQGPRAQFHARVRAATLDVVLRGAPGPSAVLDVGCGTGALLRALAEPLPAAELAGVDPAPAMLDVARASLGEGSRVRLEQATADRLPFAGDHFDLVLSTSSFHHWPDQLAGLCEIARVLRPEGRLVLVDVFAAGWVRPIAALRGRRDRMRTGPELQALLAAAGLALQAWDRVFDVGPLPLVRAATVGLRTPSSADG